MIDRNQRPRFGSDWDLDLGWVLLWWGFFLVIAIIFTAWAYASVQNNKGNVARDNFYANKCKIISRAPANNMTSSATYRCQ